MKLRQREYCHNCRQDVIYEFEDTTNRQVILCPNCGHRHYREIDEGTLLNIRINPQCRVVRIAKQVNFDDIGLITDKCDSIKAPKMEYEEHEIIDRDNEGNAIIKGGARMTERRWGRDPSQV